MYDYEAWLTYPQHRWVFNKLELAQRMGYICGPAGVPVDNSNHYIIRPTYNLNGMGVGARIEWIEKDTFHNIEPGYFWCELFDGAQYSIDYEWNNNTLVPIHASQGHKHLTNLIEFYRWEKVEPPQFELPSFVDQFTDVEHINIEFVGNRVIEIHLRWGMDFPAGATEIVPVWQDRKDAIAKQCVGWSYVDNYEDCDGSLTNPRLGFYYK